MPEGNEKPLPIIVKYRWCYSEGPGDWEFERMSSKMTRAHLGDYMRDLEHTEGCRRAPRWSAFEWHQLPDHQVEAMLAEERAEPALEPKPLVVASAAEQATEAFQRLMREQRIRLGRLQGYVGCSDSGGRGRYCKFFAGAVPPEWDATQRAFFSPEAVSRGTLALMGVLIGRLGDTLQVGELVPVYFGPSEFHGKASDDDSDVALPD